MRNFQLSICANDNAVIQAYSETLLQTYNCNLVLTANTYKQALPTIRNVKIDAVIVTQLGDIENLYEFVDDLSHIHKPPIIAVILPDMDGGKQRILQRLGATICFDSKAETHAIIEGITKRLIADSQEENCMDKALEERLASIFIASGIPPHIKGYQFLKEAVKQSVHTPSMVNNITKQLYPAIADKFNTSPSKVERAIRHAIEVAWSRGKIENINAMYGIKVFSKEEKPTNGELIALVSDKLIIECS